MFFKCAACKAKDAQVSAMRSEIEFLRGLVKPKQPQAFQAVHPIEIEADAALTGADQPIYMDLKRQAELDSEAASILSGSYS